jgi:ribosomal protein L37E
MKAWLCRRIGHKLDLDALEHGYYECVRCGAASYDPIPAQWEWTYRLVWRVGRSIDEWRSWLRKCRHCGLRFWRHTKECDDIPF